MTTKTAIDVILEELSPLAGQRLLDIGCGKGGLRGVLSEAGALWRGLDPAADATHPDIDAATAEQMPYADGSFEYAICVNALHHVPVPVMGAALAEAARVLVPEGRLVVIEPKADGALSRVIAVVDDETEIRTEAQKAMDEVKTLLSLKNYEYARTERYADFDAFCQTLLAVAPERAAMIGERRAELEAVFVVHAGREGDMYTLSQPMSARVFQPA